MPQSEAVHGKRKVRPEKGRISPLRINQACRRATAKEAVYHSPTERPGVMSSNAGLMAWIKAFLSRLITAAQ